MSRTKAEIELSAIDKTKAAFASVGANLTGIEKKALAMKSAFAGFAGIGAFAYATTSAINLADAIADASERTGFSVKSLQELRFAADQTGVSVGILEGGLGRFSKRLGLARMGTGAAADTYKKLGIDLKQANDQVFRQVVDTLGSMDDETNRLALTTRLFGDDAQVLATTFKDGSSGLALYAEKAHSLGLVLSDDLVQSASEANDQLAIMKEVLTAQFVRTFVTLAPAITAVGQAFADAAPAVADFINASMGKDISGDADAIQRRIDKLKEDLAEIRTAGGALAAVEDPSYGETKRLEGMRRQVAMKVAEIRELYDQLWNLQRGDAQKDKPKLGAAGLGGLYEDPQAKAAAAAAAEARKRAVESIVESLQLESATWGKTKEQIALYRLELALGTEASTEWGRAQLVSARAAVADVQAKEAQKKAMEEYAKEVASFTDEAREYEKAAREAADAQRALLQSVLDSVDPLSEFRREMLQLELLLEIYPEHAEAIAKAMEKLETSFGDSTDSMGQFAIEAARGIQSELGDGLYNVMQGRFGDIESDFKSMLDRLVAEALAAELASAMFGDFDKTGNIGGWAGSAFDFLGGFFGGGKASGGPVSAGSLYEVNERGPELLSVGNRDYLMVGDRDGNVTPNHRLGGGTTINVPITIYGGQGGGNAMGFSERQLYNAAYRGTAAALRSSGRG